MPTLEERRQAELAAVQAARRRRLSEEEKAELREELRRLRALRDSLPNIAPDTTSDYVREMRGEVGTAS